MSPGKMLRGSSAVKINKLAIFGAPRHRCKRDGGNGHRPSRHLSPWSGETPEYCAMVSELTPLRYVALG
jgi:hypothetical protein